MENTAHAQHTLAQRLCVRRCVNSIQKAQKESDMQLKSSSTHLDTLSPLSVTEAHAMPWGQQTPQTNENPLANSDRVPTHAKSADSADITNSLFKKRRRPQTSKEG